MITLLDHISTDCYTNSFMWVLGKMGVTEVTGNNIHLTQGGITFVLDYLVWNLCKYYFYICVCRTHKKSELSLPPEVIPVG